LEDSGVDAGFQGAGEISDPRAQVLFADRQIVVVLDPHRRA